MISVIPGRKRAEEFAASVDRNSSDAPEHLADLLEVVGVMRSLETPDPRPEFVSSLRERLMIEADEALSPVDARLTLPAHHRSGRDRRLALAAGTLALVAGTGSVAVAAQGALPGDTLYPVKRVLEGAQTSLTVGDDAKANRVLENANGRLDEIETLAARVNADSDAAALSALHDALDDFSEQADEAADLKIAEHDETGDTKPIAQLRAFTADGIDKLSLLGSVLPSDGLDSLTSAVRTLIQIDGRASALCPECGGVLEIPQNLLTALQASASSPNQVSPNTPVGIDPLGDLAVKLGKHQPELPVVDPDDLGPANVGKVPGLDGTVGGDSGRTGDIPLEETGKKAVKKLDETVRKGGDKVLGDDGVLAPLNPVLDPLLDPLVGKDGLLNPRR